MEVSIRSLKENPVLDTLPTKEYDLSLTNYIFLLSVTTQELECKTSLSSAETFTVSSEVCYKFLRPSGGDSCYTFMEMDPGDFMDVTIPENPDGVRSRFEMKKLENLHKIMHAKTCTVYNYIYV